MEIPKEILPLGILGVGLYLQKGCFPLNIRAQSNEWPEKAAKASIVGLISIVICYSISYLMIKPMFLYVGVLDNIIASYKEMLPNKHSGVLGITILLLLAIPTVVNLRYRKIENKLLLVRKYGNQLDKMYFDAFISQTPLKFTFNNSMVYVGLIVETPEPGAEKKFIKIISLLSGSTDPEKGMHFHTVSSLPSKEEANTNTNTNTVLPEFNHGMVLFLDGILTIEPYKLADHVYDDESHNNANQH